MHKLCVLNTSLVPRLPSARVNARGGELGDEAWGRGYNKYNVWTRERTKVKLSRKLVCDAEIISHRDIATSRERARHPHCCSVLNGVTFKTEY